MSAKGTVLYHPINGSPEETWDGFSWPAFFFGVIWLLVKGVWTHGIVMALLCMASGGFLLPIVWVTYGFIGNSIHRASLVKKGYVTEGQLANARSPIISVAATGAKETFTPSQVADILKQLAALKEQGALTEAEFATQKAKLLNA